MPGNGKRRFGPSRAELRLRVAVSGGGLLALVGATLYRGWPPGIAMLEILAIGGLFFGATMAASLRRLLRGDYPGN